MASGCKPDHLCFEVPMFLIPGPTVCLAIKTENKNPVDVFSSWQFSVDCAGGKSFVVDSEHPDRGKITLYWDPTGGSTCGTGTPPPMDVAGQAWTNLAYNPASNPFTLTGSRVTATTWSAAHIQDILNGSDMPYISYDADALGSGVSQGCGILYWRQIAKLPEWLPTNTPTVLFTATPTFTVTSSYTPKPIPTATFTPRPIPTFTPKPWPTPKPRILPTPVPTPRIRYIPSPQVRRYKLRPTATFVYHRPTRTPTPLPYRAPLYAPTPTRRKPTPPPVWLPKLDKVHTIIYQTPPVEIYVTFADGPGRYQLEMMDSQDNPLRMVFDKKVVAESDTWVTWDGKDERGREMPVGQYFVIFYKDGKPLRSISVVRSSR